MLIYKLRNTFVTAKKDTIVQHDLHIFSINLFIILY